MVIRPTLALSLISLALGLAACGGGGGGGGGSASTATTTTSSTSSSASSATATSTASSASSATSTASSAAASSAASSTASSATSSAASSGFALSIDCSGSNCGAASTTTYSGSGVGIWSVSASSSSALSGRFTLNNVSGKSITLVWANPQGSTSTAPASTAALLGPSSDSSFDARLATSRENVRNVLANAPTVTAAPALRSLLASATVGNTRSWYDAYTASYVSTTLRATASLSSGQQLNVWVRNADWGSGSYQVTQSMVDTLASKFATSGTGVFDLVTNKIGQPWGTHSYASTMIPATQDINIVVTNFAADSTPGGTIGYFYSVNNFLTSVYSYSNQALAFFIDSETLASPNNSSLYQSIIASTLAHEFTHMISFYKREVLLGSGYGYDTWTEEMMAEMMQDMVDPVLSSSYHNLRDNRFPGWLANGFANCNLTAFTTSSSSCFGYYTVASLGGFLQRQYGTGFLPALLARTESTSLTALEATIKSFDSSASLASALTRWATAAALLNSSTLPAGYGYPAVSAGNYSLIALNGPDFSSSRTLTALPSTFKPWSISAQTYTATGSTFTRAVTVPAGARLSVVVN